ncbi:uncharacterized protein TNCV_3091191 [Trichonephila clavipes]|uniref:Uncharacterized protein n=1 Tax=Trichonephila clavipes TaxID=2585209 RepID=A0A8X7BH64_TRICX|nr:uncharacterized protein TNCV_3091191 [Trichonephila clavipes]
MGFMVAQRLTQITPPAATPDKLWQRVEAAWSAVPQEHIQSLFESKPRRVVANLLLLGNKRSRGHLSGHVNTHNVLIWSLENPHEVLESQRDSPKLNVFCVTYRRKVYGPFVFGEPTVSCYAYLDGQQDGAPSH